MASSRQKKSVFSTAHNYHIPNEDCVLNESRTINITDAKNSSFSQPKTHLEKAVFFLRVCEILIKNKQQEPHILEEITRNISYFLQKLLEVAKDSEDLILPLIQKTEKYSPDLSSCIGEILIQILKRKYPNHTRQTCYEQEMRRSVLLWHNFHSTQIHDHKNAIRDSFLNNTEVFSLSKYEFISLNLFNQNYVWESYPDFVFNNPYNLVVFWVAVLKQFEMVIANEELEDNLCIYASLIKDDVKKLTTFLLNENRSDSEINTLSKMIDFLNYKLEGITSTTCSFQPGEIIAILQKMRWIYLT